MTAGAQSEGCQKCHGMGQIHFRQGIFVTAQTCPECSGQGYIIKNPCTECNGQSRIQKYDKKEVSIPSGIYDDAELRIPGAGDAGVYGGSAGDLRIQISVLKDKTFTRSGNDIACTVTLTYPQLVFGAEVEITNIDDSKEKLKVPKGTQVNSKITINGKGFTKIRGKGRGNLVVKIICDIPTSLNAETKETLQTYSKQIGTDVANDEGTLSGFFKRFLG
jgi:molecular chaperone DnaJ